MKGGVAIAAVCCLAATGCEKPPHVPSDAHISAVEQISSTQAAIDPAKAALICKAGIEELFKQPVASMKAEPITGGIIRVSYRRSSDNTLWKNDCKIDGDRIVWRAVDASPGSGPSRWRDDPADGMVTYKINGDRVEVIETF